MVLLHHYNLPSITQDYEALKLSPEEPVQLGSSVETVSLFWKHRTSRAVPTLGVGSILGKNAETQKAS